ncbi:MAG: thioesterase family protein [Hyphomicrobiales bacterium]|nr:thioesterase family protein [Hyphomicrobiales bacterium]MCP5371824.1 thioesterase family protein [Hyphomicrobiales bacterium]
MSGPVSFFVERDGVFVGQDPARGPWLPDYCHAGPVTGLVARAVERALGGDKVLTRLTVDLHRPVPMAGIRVRAQVARDGRRVATATATVTDLDDRLCASASSMHVAEEDIGPVPTAPVARLARADAVPGRIGSGKMGHDLPMFGHFVEVAIAAGEGRGRGPATMWMRTPPLLPDDEPSSFQRLCPLADCGNGISSNAPLDQIGFVNSDITIVAHRRTQSDWLVSRAISHWHETGVGLARAEISDEDGPVASVLQTVLLSPTGR